MIGKYIADRYEILEKIGDGGMAEVYRAKCHVLNRQVAIKVLKDKFINDKDLVARFDSEAKAAASIQHSNIVNIFDVGIDDNTHYIVMELLSNDTLKDYIDKKDGFIDNQCIVRIALQIAEGLAVAHKMGIIHRDIKSQNILMCEGDKLKVADFGIAHAVNGATTRNASEAIGSVSYASPEQSRGGHIDQRTDIYSLGVVLYELATNKVPFDGDVPVTVALKHLKEAPVLPSVINAEIDLQLEKIILKCLEKLPDNRYQNVTSLMRDLRLILKGEEINLEPIDFASAPTQVLPIVEDDVIEITGDEQQQKKSKLGFIFAGILGLLTALIVLAVLFLPKFMEVKRNPSFELPSVIGLELEIAKTKLEQAGLNVIVEESIVSDLEANRIVRQSPKVGTLVKSGQDVLLAPSRGEVAPDLFGQNFLAAQKMLESKRIELIKAGEAFSDQAEGVIISQNINPDTPIKKGDSIEVVVSLGEKNEGIVTMPELLGKTEAEAKMLLQKSNLKVGQIDYEYNDATSGEVYAQAIPAGVRVSANSEINFSVSQGKEVLVTSSPDESETESLESDISSETEVATITIEGEPQTGQVIDSQRKFHIPLGKDKNIYVIKVVAGDGESEQILHNKIHKREEESVPLIISGSGKVHLRFYKDDILIRDDIVDFDEE